MFFAFRIMLAIGFFMIAAALFGAFLWWRGTLFETRWYLRVMAQCWWIGFVAVIAGWVVTESGRQPWIVHGMLRTADAISPVPGASIAGTLALFVLAYGIVFSFGIYYINRLIAQGPQGRGSRSPGIVPAGRFRRPQDAAREALQKGGTSMEWYLPVIWAALIGTAVAMYVILDGFDLGIGILFPFARNEGERDQMMRSIAPFWDGNETWLVLGGAGLLVAFPRAYAVIMPAFYLPVIVMLLALVFRGVAFEFRIVSRSKTWWNVAFTVGSTLAAFAQGVILGGLIQGIPVEDGAFAGGPFDWATPFALLCGLALVAGYALLGATWLVMKTEGAVAERARGQAKLLLLAVLGFMAVVSLWTPLGRAAHRGALVLAAEFLFSVAGAAGDRADRLRMPGAGSSQGRDVLPFLAAIALFLLGYLGLVISNFPYLVPPSLTVWDTAAAPASQIFMLLGTLLLLPIILGYVVFIYWLFRGKVREGESYH